MSKADFFLQLQERLRGLPYEEQQNIIRVYEDLFRQAELSGKSEREIIQSLGYVPVPVPPQPPRTGAAAMRSAESGVRSVVAAIALLFFNLIFVLPFYAAAALTLFSFSLVSFLFTFSFIWIVLGTGIPNTLAMLMTEIFMTLLLTGSGVLLGLGMWKVNRGFLKLTKRYFKMNMKLIKGE